MKKGKKIYFGLLVLGLLLVSVFYGSYAIFTNKKELHGKLNIVSGTLNYKLESKYLKNNQIEIDSGDIHQFTIKITSLNKITSKYELYYEIKPSEEKVQIGYSEETEDSTKGIIEAKEEKEVKVVIRNFSDKKVTITFGVHGGLPSNEFDDISTYGMNLNKINNGDITLAWTYTGEKETPVQFPNQTDGYRVDSIECNGVSASFDNISWELKVPTTIGKQLICNLHLTDVVTMDSSQVLRKGDEVVAIDGSRWHVLEESSAGTETVTLLSDYNLKNNGTYDMNCGNSINNNPACNTIAYDPDRTSDYDENDSNNIGYFIKNTYAPKVVNALPGTINVTIPTIAQISGLTTDTAIYKDMIVSSWLSTTHYWTKTPHSVYSATSVWLVNGWNSAIGTQWTDVTNCGGARPVITTPKTNLIAK